MEGGEKVIADDSYIRESVLSPLAKVVAGFKPIMPSFQGQVSEEQLQQLIANLNLTNRVYLRGPTNGPDEALKQIDILVLPSEAEGFGLVLIEAMAEGVPVVATNAPGIRDVVRHDYNGLLVPIGAPRAIAGALELLIQDAARRERLITNGRDEVRRQFTWAPILPQYLKLLDLS